MPARIDASPLPAPAVVQAPASQWWAEPMAATDQHAIAWAQDDPPMLQAPNEPGGTLVLPVLHPVS